MKGRLKFALLLAGLYLLSLVPITAVGGLFWADLDWVERDSFLAIVERRASLFVLAALTMLGVVAVLLRAFYAKYVTPPLRLAEATRLILGANPAHRVTPEGGEEPQALAAAINAFAAEHQALRRDVEARIRDAQARVAEERNRLAALVAELTQGALVCNPEGRILLFNSRARELLGGGDPAAGGGASLVGLGRSIFAVLDRELVAGAVEAVQARLRAGVVPAVSRFAATCADRLLQVQVAPVPAPEGGTAAGLAGLILLIDDVTAAADREARRAGAFLALADAGRRSLAAIRAAVETLVAFPEMEAGRRARFAGAIQEEAGALQARLEKAEADFAAAHRPEWELQAVTGEDLAAAVARRISDRVGIPVVVEGAPPPRLHADVQALARSLAAVATWLRSEEGAVGLSVALRAVGRVAQLDLGWTGAAPSDATLAAWEGRALSEGGEASPATLAQVVERHEGETWHRADPGSRTGLFRVALPLAPAEPALPARTPPRPVPAVAAGRPEFYDFDLLAPAPLDPELDRRRLTDLAFTAFDTETTGLVPGQDEIVCIGAVRIVNGRLLAHDAFEQFVDPGRPMTEEAARLTGIDGAMLRGQPPIAQVLPQFHRFCEETVLVAHNAAFDLRFLQLEEEATGVRFAQPVLDTLLLSAVLHPNLEGHRFEEIAARFGVKVIGRHTALGDAIMVGEILLKMIPLLAAAGIVTLHDAREASARTWGAKVRY